MKVKIYVEYIDSSVSQCDNFFIKKGNNLIIPFTEYKVSIPCIGSTDTFGIEVLVVMKQHLLIGSTNLHRG